MMFFNRTMYGEVMVFASTTFYLKLMLFVRTTFFVGMRGFFLNLDVAENFASKV